jgi:hypothetical protein
MRPRRPKHLSGPNASLARPERIPPARLTPVIDEHLKRQLAKLWPELPDARHEPPLPTFEERR